MVVRGCDWTDATLHVDSGTLLVSESAAINWISLSLCSMVSASQVAQSWKGSCDH